MRRHDAKHGGLEHPTDPRMHRGGFATLAVDLLVASESGDPRRRFDVFLLARRLAATAEAVDRLPATRGLSIGYVAEGTSAAGALVASLGDPRVGAIVCRRGRPDLADGILGRVTAPTLLVTDRVGTHVNEVALELLRCRARLATVTDRRPDEGAWPDVAVDLMVGWLSRHIAATPPGEAPPAPATLRHATRGHSRVVTRSVA